MIFRSIIPQTFKKIAIALAPFAIRYGYSFLAPGFLHQCVNSSTPETAASLHFLSVAFSAIRPLRVE